jgi:hypothetical protein
MSQHIQESNLPNNAKNSVRRGRKHLPTSLVIVLLGMVSVAFFAGAYLLSFFVLTECFEEIPAISPWIPILIIVLDILCVVAIKFCPISRRARVISKLTMVSISAGVLFAVLCVAGLPV